MQKIYGPKSGIQIRFTYAVSTTGVTGVLPLYIPDIIPYLDDKIIDVSDSETLTSSKVLAQSSHTRDWYNKE